MSREYQVSVNVNKLDDHSEMFSETTLQLYQVNITASITELPCLLRWIWAMCIRNQSTILRSTMQNDPIM